MEENNSERINAVIHKDNSLNRLDSTLAMNLEDYITVLS